MTWTNNSVSPARAELSDALPSPNPSLARVTLALNRTQSVCTSLVSPTAGCDLGAQTDPLFGSVPPGSTWFQLIPPRSGYSLAEMQSKPLSLTNFDREFYFSTPPREEFIPVPFAVPDVRASHIFALNLKRARRLPTTRTREMSTFLVQVPDFTSFHAFSRPRTVASSARPCQFSQSRFLTASQPL